MSDIEKLDNIVRGNEYVDLATNVAGRVLDTSFRLNPAKNPTVRVIANDDFEEKGHSPLTAILALGYVNAAMQRDYGVDVVLGPTRSSAELPGEREIALVKRIEEGDAFIVTPCVKIGKFSDPNALGELSSKFCKSRKAHYAQHFRLGGITGEDVIVYLNAVGTDYKDIEILGWIMS